MCHFVFLYFIPVILKFIKDYDRNKVIDNDIDFEINNNNLKNENMLLIIIKFTCYFIINQNQNKNVYLNKNTKIILLIVGIIILGIFAVNYVISANLFAPGNNNNNKYIYNETEDIKQHQINNQTYITPKNYQLGRINENVYKNDKSFCI